MLLINTYVGASSIEGLGVFADESVPQGTLIWQYNPKFDVLVGTTELGVLPPHMQNYIARYSYPHLELPGFRVIDVDNGKYMNHSLTPNTDFRLFDRGFAVRDIARGEEITCNYHEFDPDFVDFVTAALASEPGRCEPAATYNG